MSIVHILMPFEIPAANPVLYAQIARLSFFLGTHWQKYPHSTHTLHEYTQIVNHKLCVLFKNNTHLVFPSKVSTFQLKKRRAHKCRGFLYRILYRTDPIPNRPKKKATTMRGPAVLQSQRRTNYARIVHLNDVWPASLSRAQRLRRLPVCRGCTLSEGGGITRGGLNIC